MDFLIQLIKRFFTEGDNRTLKLKKHIFISLFVKVGSILISFILVPLMLSYLGDGNNELAKLKYGIWITLYSFIEWIGFMDLGMGNGLRNKFGEAKALGKHELARKYVSTTYAIFVLIFGGILGIFLITTNFIHWEKFLNIPIGHIELVKEINVLVVLVVVFFSIRMIVNLISMILLADQRPSISSSFFPLSNLISLVIVFILTKISHGSLLYLGITLSAAPVLVGLIYSVYFYSNDYKIYSPSLKFVDFSYFKILGSVGIQFFIIQIAVLVIFYTDNIIITRINGPEFVTPYNLAFKYMGIVTVVFNIIVMPFWSAYTEAYAKDDISWIKNTNTQLKKVWLLALFGAIILVSISRVFYNIWVPELAAEIPLQLTIFMGIFVLIASWNNIYAYFLNGSGKIRLQLYVSVIIASLNIPLSIFFDRYLGMGPTGVILATCVCLFPGTILSPIQFKKIITKTDTGIWGK